MVKARGAYLAINRRSHEFLLKPQDFMERYEANAPPGRPLERSATDRQLKTARDILTRLKTRRGVLLADDVGTGKTTIAAIVALVVAGTRICGRRGKVRILAPNETMRRRWHDEVERLQPVAADYSHLEEATIKHATECLRDGRVEVITHAAATDDKNLSCDLLIVDEAHRGRGEHSKLGGTLKDSSRGVTSYLILTATPFSIDLNDLLHLLALAGASGHTAPVREFARHLKLLWGGSFADPVLFAYALRDSRKEAHRALKPWIIRHSVGNGADHQGATAFCQLGRSERRLYGDVRPLDIPVQEANLDQLRLIAMVDRLLSLAKRFGSWEMDITNDPRAHAGWRHLDLVLKRIGESHGESVDGDKAEHGVIDEGLGAAQQLLARLSSTIHPKARATAAKVKELLEPTDGLPEKVLIFCRHHRTAAELLRVLTREVRPHPKRTPGFDGSSWKKAWNAALDRGLENFEVGKGDSPAGGLSSSTASLFARNVTGSALQRRDAFIGWLCSPVVRTQVLRWIAEDESLPYSRLIKGLCDPARGPRGERDRTIADEAAQLYLTLDRSRSARGILKRDGAGDFGGALAHHRVVGLHDDEGDDAHGAREALLKARQPDTMLAVFNSPFGPDVLVATDRLSEGVDLHRYCRVLIHHELDPSPLRAIQRNGRLRRIDSWASRSGKPISVAYPMWTGTRDERLVSIVRQRLHQFDLLLGGVNVPADTDQDAETTKRQQEVLRLLGRRGSA